MVRPRDGIGLVSMAGEGVGSALPLAAVEIVVIVSRGVDGMNRVTVGVAVP